MFSIAVLPYSPGVVYSIVETRYRDQNSRGCHILFSNRNMGSFLCVGDRNPIHPQHLGSCRPLQVSTSGLILLLVISSNHLVLAIFCGLHHMKCTFAINRAMNKVLIFVLIKRYYYCEELCNLKHVTLILSGKNVNIIK